MSKLVNTRVVSSAACAAAMAICSLSLHAQDVPATNPAAPVRTEASTVPAVAEPGTVDPSTVAERQPPSQNDAEPTAPIRSEDTRPQAADVGPQDFLLGTPASDRMRRPPSDNLLMRLAGGNEPDSKLHQSGLVLSGYAQVGYTYNPDRSDGDIIFGRVFDDEYGNAPQLDQIELSVHRRARRDRFDVGGRVEVIWGYDTFRIHSNGLDAYGGCDEDEPNPDKEAHDPRHQFDLTQAYLDVNFEVGTGLLLRVGKFVTPLGYETIDPTSTPFYSRSYLFGFAKPFTHTGALANYRLNEEWEVWGGVVRGWDQALEDTNDSVSFLGRVDWRPDPRWNFRLGVITGKEGSECDCGCTGNDETRTLIDFIATHAVTDRFGLGVEALYGVGSKSDENDGSAQWYGVAGYASYALTPATALNARLEWFRDENGTRLRTGSSLELTSLTVGLSIEPFQSDSRLEGLKIQPEIRYDHASNPEFDGGSERDQITLGVGVLYAF